MQRLDGPTGIEALDRATGGGKPGELWLVQGSRESVTWLLLGVARAMARNGSRVRWITASQEPDTLTLWATAAEARVLVANLQSGQLADAEHERASTRPVPDICFELLNDPVSDLRVEVESSKSDALVVVDLWQQADAATAIAKLAAAAAARGTWVLATGPGEPDAPAGVSLRLDVHRPSPDAEPERAGEVDVRVRRPGQSSVLLTLAEQSRFARIVDMAT